jgi:hypothetical protein
VEVPAERALKRARHGGLRESSDKHEHDQRERNNADRSERQSTGSTCHLADPRPVEISGLLGARCRLVVGVIGIVLLFRLGLRTNDRPEEHHAGAEVAFQILVGAEADA